MKHTKPETQDSLDKSVPGTVTVSETEPTTPLVPSEIKNTEQESKINELTKLIQMLIDEKVNSTQMTQESNSKIQQTESSKSVDSSKGSQDSKPKVQNVGSSKILYCMICKREDHRTSDHEMYTASLKKSKNYKAQPYQYASSSKQILKAKANPFPPCTHCGFNDHRHDDCRNYPEFEISRSYDHFTLGYNRRHIRKPIWCMDSGCSRSMTGVKSYLHKYVEQPGPKVVFGDNSSCITEGYGSINYGGIVFTKVAFVNGLKYNLISISQLCDAKYIVKFNDKQGTIFNANKEIVLIAPRRNDVYDLDMTSLSPNGACFFAKASESLTSFARGRIDNILFIYKSKGEVLLVQVYVDDIIFGSTSYKLCKQFEKPMTKKFEMSMMGELTYFLGLQIKQDDKGISICQEQYTKNLLNKYEIFDSSLVKTPMVPPNNLGLDLAGKSVNKTSYRGMIRSLMYFTATRPDIQFSTVLCARYQSNPKESHLIDVKRILRYLKGRAVCIEEMSNHKEAKEKGGGQNKVKGRKRNRPTGIKIKAKRKYKHHLDEPTFNRLKAELGMLNID
ncbi:retrovirus-related pol polyprotein from transposon TNT 1-94 [Tanacetum coccineum]